MIVGVALKDIKSVNRFGDLTVLVERDKIIFWDSVDSLQYCAILHSGNSELDLVAVTIAPESGLITGAIRAETEGILIILSRPEGLNTTLN